MTGEAEARRLAEQEERTVEARRALVKARERIAKLEAALSKAEQERDEALAQKQDDEIEIRREYIEQLHAAEARERDLREALQEQWEAAHFDHCSRLEDDGVCHNEDTSMGCQWPKPAALQATQTPSALPTRPCEVPPGCHNATPQGPCCQEDGAK